MPSTELGLLPWLAIGCLLRARLMLAPVAHEGHHPFMLALLVLDILSPLWGMLSTKLGLLPWLAIGCTLGARLMLALVACEGHHPFQLIFLAEAGLPPWHTI